MVNKNIMITNRIIIKFLFTLKKIKEIHLWLNKILVNSKNMIGALIISKRFNKK
jgi:hypothetical protein